MDSLVMLVAVFDVFDAFVIVFVICELGQRPTNAYEDLEDVIGQFDWYLFPIELQRMLPTFTNLTQQTIELPCFGSFACSRETFKKVRCTQYVGHSWNHYSLKIMIVFQITNTAFSYFTALRNFDLNYLWYMCLACPIKILEKLFPWHF